MVGLTESVFLEDDDKLMEILRQFLQFDLLLGWTQTEPALGFCCMPLPDRIRYP